MHAFATGQDEELLRQELERRVRNAWTGYSESLEGLEGREYDEAEAAAWDRLQRRLDELAR